MFLLSVGRIPWVINNFSHTHTHTKTCAILSISKRNRFFFLRQYADLSNAATKIQASFRGHKARKEAEKARKEIIEEPLKEDDKLQSKVGRHLTFDKQYKQKKISSKIKNQ